MIKVLPILQRILHHWTEIGQEGIETCSKSVRVVFQATIVFFPEWFLLSSISSGIGSSASSTVLSTVDAGSLEECWTRLQLLRKVSSTWCIRFWYFRFWKLHPELHKSGPPLLSCSHYQRQVMEEKLVTLLSFLQVLAPSGFLTIFSNFRFNSTSTGLLLKWCTKKRLVINKTGSR